MPGLPSVTHISAALVANLLRLLCHISFTSASQFLSWQDVGIFGYINEQTTEVDRVTQMNDPEVTLSADQTDIIHNSVLRQMKRSGKDENSAVLMTGSRRHSDGVDAAHPASSAQGGCAPAHPADPNSDNQSDDDTFMLDPQPFAKLMCRLGSSRGPPAKKGRTGPPCPKPVASRNKGAKRKSEPALDPQPQPQPDPCDARSGEDEQLVESYNSQLNTLKVFDPPSSDDSAFPTWARARIQKITEVRVGVQAKRKSLNRRKFDCSVLMGTLDGIIEHCSVLIAQIKPLVSVAGDGKSIYQELSTLFDTAKVWMTPPAWERVLKAVAFEDSPAQMTERLKSQNKQMSQESHA